MQYIVFVIHLLINLWVCLGVFGNRPTVYKSDIGIATYILMPLDAIFILLLLFLAIRSNVYGFFIASVIVAVPFFILRAYHLSS